MGHFRKRMISIFMTSTCNMKCMYCYLEKNEGNLARVIDVQFAKRGIEDFFLDNEEPAVRFFAEGEPTLAFKEMVEIKEYADRLSKHRAIYELQTNGMFGRSVAEWIRDNINIVFISLDGPPDIQDALRVTKGGLGTSDILEKNIRILQENPKLQLGIRATINALNNNRQIEMIDYFYSLGIRIVFGDLIFSSVGSTEKPLNVGYKEFVDEYIKARKYAENQGVFYGTMFAANFDEEVTYACRACLPTPHLTVDGYVSCCDMCVRGDSILKELIYGKYDPINNLIEYDTEAIRKIRSRRADNIEECKNCEVKHYCAGGCLGEALNETGNFWGVKEDSCRAIRYLWESLDSRPIKLPYLHP